MKLSIIIPTYNEENTIRELISYVQSVKYPIPYEIVIIDDASIDRTYEKELLLKIKNRAEENNIRIFKNKINRGKGFSIRKGIKRSTGDIIVIQDADTEYNPKEIPGLLAPILNGESLAVYGSRFMDNRHPEGMSFLAYLANRFLTKMANFLFGLSLTDMETCYKVFQADIIKGLPLITNRFTFEPEVTALLTKKGIKIKELPISYRGRSWREGKKIKAKDFFFACFVLLWYWVK